MKNKFYELQFEIETSCLLDCVHCSSAQTRLLNERKFLDRHIVNMINLLDGEKYVYFTGGEPLLYSNILSLCKEITFNTKETSIGIYTTGNLKGLKPITIEYANKMKKSGIIDCYFSIYSDSSEEHDKFTKTPGSFGNTITSIQNLNLVGISTKAHLVLTKYNIERIDNLISFCEKIGIDEIRLLKLIPSGNAKNNWNNIGIPLKEQDEAIQKIVFNKHNYRIPISISGYPKIHPCRPFPDSNGCQAGINLLYIDSLGNIYPCACTKSNSFKYKICNIIETDCIKKYISSIDNKNFRKYCLNRYI